MFALRVGMALGQHCLLQGPVKFLRYHLLKKEQHCCLRVSPRHWVRALLCLHMQCIATPGVLHGTGIVVSHGARGLVGKPHFISSKTAPVFALQKPMTPGFFKAVQKYIHGHFVNQSLLSELPLPFPQRFTNFQKVLLDLQVQVI